jgi:hypothetical protein
MKKFTFLLHELIRRFRKQTFCCLLFLITIPGFSQVFLPKVWLKADSLNSSSKIWPDYGHSGYDAVFSADSFSKVKAVINYNPAVKLDGNKKKYFRIPYHQIKNIPQQVIISVFYSADSTECGLWATDSLCSRAAGQTTRNVLNMDSTFTPYMKSEGRPMLNRLVQQWELGYDITADSTSMLILGSFGPQQDSIPSFKGHLAEFLVFDQVPLPLEMIQTETYLAIKYGIYLEASNYVCSDKRVLWDRKNDSLYCNRITGLGRDDYFKLNQKQSTSAIGNGFLSIGAEKIAETNQKNSAKLKDKQFLLWGDNNGGLSLPTGNPAKVLPLGRRWLMKAFGQDSLNIKTQVRLNRNRLTGRDSVYFLIIDRTGTGQFSNPVFFKNDTIISDSIVVFNNILWDTDHSGMDNFSFGISKKLKLKVAVLRNPTCPYSDEGKAQCMITGGHPPYKYTLQKNAATLLTWTAALDTIFKTGLKAGVFDVLVTDALGLTDKVTIRLTAPDSLHFKIGNDQVLRQGSVYEASIAGQIPDSIHVTYQWKGSQGYSNKSSKVNLTVPDLYSLSLTTDSGCVYKDSIKLMEGNLKRFEVTPTLVGSQDGRVNIDIALDTPMEISVLITDGLGFIYYSVQDSGKKAYSLSTNLINDGLYVVYLNAKQIHESKKVVVAR